MAAQTHTWFDESKLLPGERLVRQSGARLRIDSPPYWWEGTLFLTTDRLFFLHNVQHPLEDATAFWISDIARSAGAGHNRFAVMTETGGATFEIDGPVLSAPGLAGLRARPWLDAIAALAPVARTPDAFETRPRRAAG